MPMRRFSGGSAQPAPADDRVAELHRAVVGRLEARDQPQQRGLAAAGRAEQREEFAVGDRRG